MQSFHGSEPSRCGRCRNWDAASCSFGEPFAWRNFSFLITAPDRSADPSAQLPQAQFERETVGNGAPGKRVSRDAQIGGPCQTCGGAFSPVELPSRSLQALSILQENWLASHCSWDLFASRSEGLRLACLCGIKMNTPLDAKRKRIVSSSADTVMRSISDAFLADLEVSSVRRCKCALPPIEEEPPLKPRS